MDIRFLVTAIWLLIIGFSASVAKYRKLPFPSLKKTVNLIFLTLESINIALIYYFRDETSISNKYCIFLGVILIIVGWQISYQNFIGKLFKSWKYRHYISQIQNVIAGNLRPNNTYYYGDVLQILGISLIWNTVFYTTILIAVYLVLVYILSVISTQKHFAEEKVKSRIKNYWFIHFVSNIFRVFIIAIIPLILFLVISRDYTLFIGTYQDAFDLLMTLAQVEATVFALVITFLFVLIEYANSSYSPRLVGTFSNLFTFKLMAFLAILSICGKFFIISRSSIYLDLELDSPGSNIWMDWVLLWAVLVGISYYIFIENVIRLMTPEGVANHILSSFNEIWIEVVRDEWAVGNSFSRQRFNLTQDPLVAFERYLAATIEKRDVNSFSTAIGYLKNKLNILQSPEDGVVLDNYLSERLKSTIQIAAEQKSEDILIILRDICEDVTIPSAKSIKDSSPSMFDIPLGSKLLRQILEVSIENHLTEPCYRTSHLLGDRGTRILSNLPGYSELSLINPDNQDLPLEESKQFWANDRKLNHYTDQILGYFGNIGEIAAQQKLNRVVWAVTSSLVEQINATLDNIKEERYRVFILRYNFYALDKIVNAVCAMKLKDSLGFNLIKYGSRKELFESEAILLTNYFCRFIDKTSKAGVLDVGLVIDLSVAMLDIKLHYPELAIKVINSFGSAGEVLLQNDDFFFLEERDFIFYELDRRIDQIKPFGKDKKMQSLITKTVNTAKRKLKYNHSNKRTASHP